MTDKQLEKRIELLAAAITEMFAWRYTDVDIAATGTYKELCALREERSERFYAKFVTQGIPNV